MKEESGEKEIVGEGWNVTTERYLGVKFHPAFPLARLASIHVAQEERFYLEPVVHTDLGTGKTWINWVVWHGRSGIAVVPVTASIKTPEAAMNEARKRVLSMGVDRFQKMFHSRLSATAGVVFVQVSQPPDQVMADTLPPDPVKVTDGDADDEDDDDDTDIEFNLDEDDDEDEDDEDDEEEDTDDDDSDGEDGFPDFSGIGGSSRKKKEGAPVPPPSKTRNKKRKKDR